MVKGLLTYGWDAEGQEGWWFDGQDLLHRKKSRRFISVISLSDHSMTLKQNWVMTEMW